MFKKAATLEQVPAMVALTPLRHGDQRHVDLTAGMGTTELEQFRLRLNDADAAAGRFAKIAFTGHRGSGKTTELHRLEHDVSRRFTPLYVTIANNVIRDCDYLDILVWLAENLIRQYSLKQWSLNSDLVVRITDWFARKSFDDVEKVKEEIRSESGTDMQAEFGFYWMTIQIFNRIKSMMSSEKVHRQAMRKRLHTYTAEMLYHINLLLDDARQVLVRKGKSPDLLIVQDNLDRVPTDVARRLFFDSADVLQALRVHYVFTVPISLTMPPFHISDSFDATYVMPMLKPPKRRRANPPQAMQTLRAFVGKRLVIEDVFVSGGVLDKLIIMSAGNPRDLLKLLYYAQLAARARRRKRIDAAAADTAIRRLRLYYEKLMIPSDTTYPILARIHATGREHFHCDAGATGDTMVEARHFGGELLATGAVIDYCEGNSRYAVHPLIPGIAGFRDFCRHVAIPGPDNVKM